jgi:hypothetical protein
MRAKVSVSPPGWQVVEVPDWSEVLVRIDARRGNRMR